MPFILINMPTVQQDVCCLPAASTGAWVTKKNWFHDCRLRQRREPGGPAATMTARLCRHALTWPACRHHLFTYSIHTSCLEPVHPQSAAHHFQSVSERSSDSRSSMLYLSMTICPSCIAPGAAREAAAAAGEAGHAADAAGAAHRRGRLLAAGAYFNPAVFGYDDD